MKAAAKMVHRALVGSGALALLFGLIIWTGNGVRLIPIHELLGYVLFISWWTIAATAARSGVCVRIVALAATWGLLALILAIAQKRAAAGRLAMGDPSTARGERHRRYRILPTIGKSDAAERGGFESAADHQRSCG